jgi:hypothetical protein
MRPTTKLPLGIKRGLDELKVVLDASEPTNVPSIRRVLISVPEELPEYFRSNSRVFCNCRYKFTKY